MSASSKPKRLTSALLYASRGWPVFPIHCATDLGCTCRSPSCASPGKHPLTPRGFYDATTDPKIIEGWWSENRWANVGIPTGAASGLTVLDVDPRNGGEDSLARLVEENGPLPPTPVCATGGGGTHYYFQGAAPKAKLAPGLDLQGEGGYVVAPFSLHRSGREYTWAINPSAQGLAPLPDWLTPSPLDTQGSPTPRAAAYEEGQRNDRLFRDACAMRRRGLTEASILAALLEQNLAKCQPPLTEYEVRSIVASAQRYTPIAERGLGPGIELVERKPNGTGSNPFERSLGAFDGILDPNVGAVDYVVDDLLPRANFTLIAAEWKTGKTLLIYRLILDLLEGTPAFGSLEIDRPYRVGLLQLEMPLSEDLRRFRKLAIGLGLPPAKVLAHHEAGRLVTFTQPQVSLAHPETRAHLHESILRRGIEVLIVDSLLAGFAPADTNDNPTVRNLIATTFIPLTLAGVTCVGIHHYKKVQQPNGAASPSQAKAAVLGGIQFGAAAARTYGVERLTRLEDAEGNERNSQDFAVRISALGSWTPTESSYVIGVTETYDKKLGGEGTSVRILGPAEQIRQGGISAAQQAALALAALVKKEHRISRPDALALVGEELGLSARTLKNALKIAKDRGWVGLVPRAEGSQRGGPVDLVPGEVE